MDKHPRVLVVDDDENIRKVLIAILEDEGYVVESAGTAKKAIEMTKRKFYNVALIDIRLPDMEGTELLIQIKDTIPRMRKIIVTGYPTLQNAIDAVNRKADAYINNKKKRGIANRKSQSSSKQKSWNLNPQTRQPL
jgi:DNA-binding NtrC family response regulator